MHKILKFSMIVGLFLGMVGGALFWVSPSVIASPDGFEPNNSVGTATAITPGIYEGLTIDAGDVDYYNITLNVGDNISAILYNMVAIFDLSLCNTSGNVLDSSLGGTETSKAVWDIKVPEAGNYTILVTGNGANSGSYNMQVMAQFIDDIYEENDDPMHPCDRPFPSITSNLAAYDWDFFKVTVGPNQCLNVTVRRSIIGASIFGLILFNSSLVTLSGVTVMVGTSGSIFYRANNIGETFIIGVIPSGGEAWGNYSLILQEAVDAYEENDVVSDATPVNFDSYEESNAVSLNSLLLDDDVDWFQVLVNAGETLWVSFGPSANVTFQLTTNMGVPLVDAFPHPVNGYLFANYSIITGGIYKIRVYANDSSHSINYGIRMGRLNVTHPTDITYAPAETGHSITWNLDDTFLSSLTPETVIPAGVFTAQIYYNGDLTADTYEWNRTKPVIIDVDGLAEGTHTFKIVAEDYYNCTVEDIVVVTVAITQPGNNNEEPPNSIPGYSVALLAGFNILGILSLTKRKRRISAQS